MGLWDTLEFGINSTGDVKCFGCCMKVYRIGDEVPSLHNYSDYGIVLREGEGSVALIRKGKLIGNTALRTTNGRFIDSDGTVLPLFDKWGDLWTGQNRGLWGEGYFFARAYEKD